MISSFYIRTNCLFCVLFSMWFMLMILSISVHCLPFYFTIYHELNILLPMCQRRVACYMNFSLYSLHWYFVSWIVWYACKIVVLFILSNIFIFYIQYVYWAESRSCELSCYFARINNKINYELLYANSTLRNNEWRNFFLFWCLFSASCSVIIIKHKWKW